MRVWDSRYTSQIMCFDLSMMVVDAVWAPYSSTGILKDFKYFTLLSNKIQHFFIIYLNFT